MLPFPLSFLQGATIKFRKIICGNICEVAIQMPLIYWARLRAEKATWLPVKPNIILNTTRQTSFISKRLAARLTLSLNTRLFEISGEFQEPVPDFRSLLLLIQIVPTSKHSGILDDSGRLQTTHTSADIVIGWTLNLYYPFRKPNYLNT